MFIIRNCGKFPVLIRDLNLHVSGDKEVNLDLITKRENADKSFDLQKLIDAKKIEVVRKDGIPEKKTEIKVKPQEKPSQNDNTVLLELRKDVLSIKDLLQSGININYKEKIEEVDDETRNRLIDLKVHNLSKDSISVEKNYDKIGNSTEKKESLSDLLDTLDNLDNGRAK